MSIDVQTTMFTHQSGNRVSVFSIVPGGGLNLRVKNGGEESRVCIDAFSHEERKALADFLLQGIDD